MFLEKTIDLETYECESCGFDVPMPEYVAEWFRERDYAGQRNICSNCAEQERADRKEKRDYLKHKPQGVEKPWSCEFCPEPAQCTGDCWRGPDLVLEEAPAKVRPKQGELF